MNNQNNIRILLKNSLLIGRPYFLTAMIKFPRVFSKNGILNSFLCILVVGGICSSFSNLILSKVSTKINQKTYSDISQQVFGKYHSIILIILFLQKSFGIFYCVDLSYKLLHSIELLKFKVEIEFLIFLFILNLFSALIFNKSEKLNFARSRNILSLIVLLVVTAYGSVLKFSENLPEINFYNKSESFFENFGLLTICFAQQILTTPLVCGEMQNKKTTIILSGFITSFSYIGIGIAGYIYCLEPEINWFINFKNIFLKNLGSIILLLVNLLAFPLLIQSVTEDLNRIMPETIMKNLSFFSKYLAIIFYSLTSVFFVSTKSLIIYTLIISSTVTMLIPSIIYNKIFSFKKLKWRLISGFNILVGILLIGKALGDIFNLYFVNK